MPEERRSPWFWLGCGCLGCLSLMVLALLAVFLLGLRAARSLESGFADPETRERTVTELLGTERLPEGYHPFGGIQVPFFLDAAMLSSRPQPTDSTVQSDDRFFVYFQASRWLTQMMGGEVELAETGGIEVETDEQLGEGEIQLPHYRFDWTAQRGDVVIEGQTLRGILAVMRLHCFTGPERFRMAIWIVPDDQRDTTDPAALAGTPADAEALRAMMAPLDPCH